MMHQPMELSKIPEEVRLALPPAADKIRLLGYKDFKTIQTEVISNPNTKISRYFIPYNKT